MDIELLLYPRKKNSMELGVGFATDTGPHVQIGWTKPWINSRGHSFRTNLYISAPKQNFEATYKMPLLKNPLNYYYEFSTGYEKENKNDTDTKALTFAALRYWNNSEGWQYLQVFVSVMTATHKLISPIKHSLFILPEVLVGLV